MSGWRFRSGRNPQWGGIFFRLILLLAIAAVLLLIYAVRHPLLGLAGEMLVVNERPQASDAIVILGDDNYQGQRAKRAAEILHEGWAPRIVCSGRYLRPYANIAQLEQHDLLEDGVPASAIVPFPNYGANTGEEALAVSQFLESHGWKRVIVVTSTYHTRRARYIYRHILPSGDELRVIAAPDSAYDPKNWWRSYDGADLFGHEVAGYFAAMWALRHHDFHVQTAGQ